MRLPNNKEKDGLTLTASRLPIITKNDLRKRKSVLGYDDRMFSQLPSPPRAHNQQEPLSLPAKKEKPYLTGWEMEDNWL